MQVGGKPLEKRPLIGNPTFGGLDALQAMQPKKAQPAAAAGGTAMPVAAGATPRSGAGLGAFDAFVDEQLGGTSFKASTKGKPGWRATSGKYRGKERNQTIQNLRSQYAGMPDAQKAGYERRSTGADLDQSTAMPDVEQGLGGTWSTPGMDQPLPGQPEQGPMMAPGAMRGETLQAPGPMKPTSLLSSRKKKRPLGAFSTAMA